MVRLLFVSLLCLQGALALSTLAQESREQSSAKAYVDPNVGGGSVIDISSSGLVEPLNVIISGLSSPAVLTNDGFTKFANAIGFKSLCPIGFCSIPPPPQAANLGDGHGLVNQTLELRKIEGGLDVTGYHYLRLFRQNGPKADTGALFLAVFQEDDDGRVTANSYNIGRDNFATDATLVTSYQGVKYQTFSERITGLLGPGTPLGINQGSTTDGVVVLLTVMIIP